MKVYHSIENFTKLEYGVVTTGTFDGVHIGHQKIIKRLTQLAEKESGETVIITFFPHPRMVLFPHNDELRLLNTQQEKITLIEQSGIDHLIILPFTKAFSRISSTEFVRDIIVNKIGTKKLVIGYNHQFGRNREGTFEHLKEYSGLYGFEVEEIPALDIDDVNVSSTKIRKAIEQGYIDVAFRYLNYSYQLTGKVISGDKIGRTLGFPTANIAVLDETKLIPAHGVYAVKVLVNSMVYGGMLNIGVRPTVSNANKQTIEVNIFNFDDDIYGKEITVKFVKRIRNEMKFESVEKMKEEMIKDKLKTIEYLK